MYKKQSRQARWWTFILLVILIVSIAACTNVLGDSCDADTMDMLRVQMPPSGSNLTEKCSPGVGPGNAQYTATFTILPNDVETLQQSTRITEWGSSVPDSAMFAEEAAQMSSVSFGSYSDGTFMEEVLIDTTNSEVYTVHYFHASVD